MLDSIDLPAPPEAERDARRLRVARIADQRRCHLEGTSRRPTEQIYKSILRSRLLEEALADALRAGEPVHVGHPASGQEGVAAGVCSALEISDRLYCAHRAKHWALAKGCDLTRLAAEFCGKATGYSGGWGGEMHMRDPGVGFMGSNHVVGSSMPSAVGAALASKLSGAMYATVVAFGDGASVQGTFHEALNLAAIWNLPILFVCENNHYAESTPVEYFSATDKIYTKAAPFGIDAMRVDGQDANQVFDAANRFACDIKDGGGPRFIEAVTYRYSGHYFGDVTRRYRTENEEATWRDRDPLRIYEDYIERAGGLNELISRVRAEVESEVERAIGGALAAPYPSLHELNNSPYCSSVLNEV